jgi:hypothetical protein
MNGTWLSTIAIALLAALALPGCKDFPGADGRYATHDGATTNVTARPENAVGRKTKESRQGVSCQYSLKLRHAPL